MKNSYLLDTNIIGRQLNPDDPDHEKVIAALRELNQRGCLLFVSAQNLVEFRAMATRPSGPPSNGLGMTAREADTELITIRHTFDFLPDSSYIYDE